MLRRCREQAEPVKNWRNKLLAHNDIDHVLGQKQVGALSLERLDRIAASLDELGNLIWVALYDGEIVLSTGGFSSAAAQLLSQLKRSRDLMLLEHYAYSPKLCGDDLGRIVAEYRSKGLPDDIANPPNGSG